MQNSWDEIFNEYPFWYSNITILLKTFIRYECCQKIINTWNLYYPNINIILVDDTPIKHKNSNLSLTENIKYIYLDKIVGLSYGRNIAILEANTEYIFLADDDNMPPNPNILKQMYNILCRSDYDIIGPNPPYEISISNGILSCYQSNYTYGDIFGCDAVLNHFLAKKNKIPKWDNNIKIGHEHVDFFLSCKQENVSIASYKKLMIESIKKDYKESSIYNRYRYDLVLPEKYLLNKWDLLGYKKWGIK